MHKTKRKSSTETMIPRPIKVKKEKTEEDRTLNSMAHYVDDRLELVKQIFGTLKPKTIINLAPDFLKQKNMMDIEEQCLHELLCISTKRLLSIINATKCPTDTESDGDSDVERKEEHISLEEISSDSEVESSTAKKKNNGTTSGKAKHNAKNSNDNQESKGPISVLELLELQARARAIRSQLAMEPVTKIEVNSDDGEDKQDTKAKIVKSKKDTNSSKRNSSNDERLLSTSSKEPISIKPSSTIPTTTITQNDQPNIQKINAPRKIKLKRNYKKRVEEDETNPAESVTNTPEVVQEKPPATIVKMDTNQERSSRSVSPDVIPIMAETETLLISDSSDGEDGDKKLKSKVGISAVTVTEATEETHVAVVPDEIEEGEITDSELMEEETKPKAAKEEPNALNYQTDDSQSQQTVTDASNKNTETISESTTEQCEKSQPISEEEIQIKSDVAPHTSPENEPASIKKAELTDEQVGFNEDDDQNDDVISIGGDLESEMIEHLEENISSKSSFVATSKEPNNSKSQDDDIISLDSSSDERVKEDSESWHSRYLKSTKVNKVLLASRLGKRVRDKIKKSKQASSRSETKDVFRSRHEDGSVEQYNELVEMRQHKS